jgi:hypothetical protein
MQVEQKGREIEKSEQIEVEESDVYSLFVYAVRLQVTRDYYLRQLRIFLDHIGLLPAGTMEDRCNLFASKGKKDPSWVFSCIVRFLQYQKERVEREEITGATLRNFVKAIKLFYEMSGIPHFMEKDQPWIAKNKEVCRPTIILVSTPKAPGGLMQQIELEPDSLYYKLFFDYHYGLEGPSPIISVEQIEKDRLSPEWGREYEGKYLGVVGNVFSHSSIESAQKISYNPDEIIPNTKVSIGIDPSFGSSSFGIVVTRFVNKKIQVVIAEEHTRTQFSSMIDRIWQIKKQFGFTAIYVDAANLSIWQDLKREFGERYDSKYVFSTLAEYEKNNWDINSIMRIIPVPFSTNHPKMLQHAKSLLDDPHDLVAIHPRFDKLLISLRTATAEEYKLKKENTSFNDILDAFRLSLQFYRRRN